jgi:hypothetical protein
VSTRRASFNLSHNSAGKAAPITGTLPVATTNRQPLL